MAIFSVLLCIHGGIVLFLNGIPTGLFKHRLANGIDSIRESSPRLVVVAGYLADRQKSQMEEAKYEHSWTMP